MKLKNTKFRAILLSFIAFGAFTSAQRTLSQDATDNNPKAVLTEAEDASLDFLSHKKDDLGENQGIIQEDTDCLTHENGYNIVEKNNEEIKDEKNLTQAEKLLVLAICGFLFGGIESGGRSLATILSPVISFYKNGVEFVDRAQQLAQNMTLEAFLTLLISQIKGVALTVASPVISTYENSVELSGVMQRLAQKMTLQDRLAWVMGHAGETALLLEILDVLRIHPLAKIPLILLPSFYAAVSIGSMVLADQAQAV